MNPYTREPYATKASAEPIQNAIRIWNEAVRYCDPRSRVCEHVLRMKRSLTTARRIIAVGGGKAGTMMALGLEDALEQLGGLPVEGIVNVPEGNGEKPRRILLNHARAAGSNFPTEAGINGSKRMLKHLAECGPKDVAICLISGGGSALMAAPLPGLTLEEKLKVTRLLHACGATIREINCVRKHLSEIKGGRLARAFRGRKLYGLILSDVEGDPIDVIASGPTTADPTTRDDALEVLKRYVLLSKVPEAVLAVLNRPDCETPKRLPAKIVNCIIGSNGNALFAAGETSKQLGYTWRPHKVELNGEAREAALRFARLARGPFLRPVAIPFGGETTVTLGPNPGKGGRNQEFVLAMLCELGLDGMKGVTILSGGTDGEDGPTDAAGAIGTRDTLLKARELNLDPHDYLRRHDAYHFFEKTGGLFKTGLTGTNVMDLGVILLENL